MPRKARKNMGGHHPVERKANVSLRMAENQVIERLKKEHPDWHKSLRDSLNQGSVKQRN